MSKKVTATVRMYRLNELGDCFLLSFVTGGQTSRVLIDCGSFRNGGPSTQRLDKIVASIATETGGTPLDVVVGTHQHNDHLSGFVHCEDAFKAIGVSQVWLSWLDDPSDPQAREIGQDYNNLLLRLTSARHTFDAKTALDQPADQSAAADVSSTRPATVCRQLGGGVAPSGASRAP
jgi:glyoxylase-like metal-dependent hydrolase (beta-lactamase superfamily II)